MRKKERALVADKTITKIYCNKCGRLIGTRDKFEKVDYLSVKKEWGYFSNKDMEIHSFELCEHCYDELIKQLKIPPEITSLLQKNDR